ncbi:MAG: hypothetical protein AB7N76_03140 [Planctomycetota bacterium]
MRRPTWLLCAAALGLCGLPTASRADTVTLNNGREIHGRLVEEQKELIKIRTAGGVISIPKFKVATFSENETWGYEGKPRSVEQLKQIEADKKAADEAARAGREGGTPGTPGTPTTPTTPKAGGGNGGGAKAGDGEWRWGPEVSKEKIEELTPIRDQLQTELKNLGLTKEERLDAIKLSGEQEADIKQRIQQLGWQRGRGGKGRGGMAGSAVRREAAREELVATYGERAIPALVTALSAARLWEARTAADALSDIIKGSKDPEATRWLFRHFQAHAGLLRLMDNEGDITSPFVRLEGNEAMEAITGKTMGWPAGVQEALRTRPETIAYRKWVEWDKQDAAAWQKEEERKVKRRQEIAEAFEKLKNGENPLENKDGKEG